MRKAFAASRKTITVTSSKSHYRKDSSALVTSVTATFETQPDDVSRSNENENKSLVLLDTEPSPSKGLLDYLPVKNLIKEQKSRPRNRRNLVKKITHTFSSNGLEIPQ